MTVPQLLPEDRADLLQRHQSMLRAYIRSMLPTGREGDDILQEVGVRVLRDRDSIVGPEQFGAWCRGIARNLILQHWDRQGRRKEVPMHDYLDVVERAYDQHGDELQAGWQLREEALRVCLGQVSDDNRALLEWRYVSGLPSHEIGQRQGRSAEAVRRALMRLRDALRACVERRLRDSGTKDES